ncbi:MAG: radical SAM protein [Hormoscilla sp. GUM202]|nr:radical SAM protein [Hormoscilla sp. GUM202]
MLKGKPALVIDVTYRCNATCGYCQWGAPGARGREITDNLRVPAGTLSALGIKRVVFSGGEPLLRGDLEKIAAYYREAGINSVVVISNGLRLFPNRLKSLLGAGVTGVSASLDGVTPDVAHASRGMTGTQHEKIMRNIEAALEFRWQMQRPFEFVVNTVLSKANLKLEHMAALVDFCNRHSADWLKFNPVFDDGYLGANAPWLNFSRDDAKLIRELGEIVTARAAIKTNPPWFWNTVADVVGGEKRLKGGSCGLDKGQVLLARGELKFCAWIKTPVYGRATETISAEQSRLAIAKFRRARASCRTGAWCFCLQDIGHRWEVE